MDSLSAGIYFCLRSTVMITHHYQVLTACQSVLPILEKEVNNLNVIM